MNPTVRDVGQDNHDDLLDWSSHAQRSSNPPDSFESMDSEVASGPTSGCHSLTGGRLIHRVELSQLSHMAKRI